MALSSSVSRRPVPIFVMKFVFFGKMATDMTGLIENGVVSDPTVDFEEIESLHAAGAVSPLVTVRDARRALP